MSEYVQLSPPFTWQQQIIVFVLTLHINTQLLADYIQEQRCQKVLQRSQLHNQTQHQPPVMPRVDGKLRRRWLLQQICQNR